ncbi:FeoA family protein [Clostridium senegalense]|uniref:FeoA family protein n=1 Tax=Clostridium senegalense TaxID=1465809 RepID=UPI0002893112|nr:FeoA family protein [Clostridium senegalense]MBU5226735.1 ferrous iron transport protein A [Clostridium senegalense]
MEDKIFKLSECNVGETVEITSVLSTGLSKQRLLDLGFVPNTKIFILRESPFGEPVAYLIRETCIALRKEESENILVRRSIL